MRSVACSKRMQFLRPVLTAFLGNLERFAEAQGWEDFGHAYNERATLSLFAAACWQSDLIAIEEYISRKGWGGKARNGRGDLWARCPKTDNQIIFEAKQHKAPLGVEDETIRQTLMSAESDARRNYDAALRAGLSFFTPVLPAGVERDEVVGLFRRIQAVALDHGADAMALWYPDEATPDPADARRNGQDWMFPGVVAVVRLAAISGQRSVPDSERLSSGHRFRKLELA